MSERRQNVRVHPVPDYDIIVEYSSGLVSVRLQVIDIAIGGMGLLTDELFAGAPVGSPLPLRLTFPGAPKFETSAEVRHCSKAAGGKCGVALSKLSDEERTLLQHAVAELQERGFSA
jgi:c-di-GMP-binding flagellar brake protein YcgR